MDNQTAKITSGERIPFTVVTANGPTTRFVEATLTLEVVPHITGDGAVLMRIKAQQNEVSDRRDNFGTPGLFVREAETEMVVSDGDTAVLGGIYRRGQRESISQVPFLGDIPVLGWLFKSRTDADERDELLIFVTPRILNRSEAGVTGG
jgi:type IV pilus assembly protein PilQ